MLKEEVLVYEKRFACLIYSQVYPPDSIIFLVRENDTEAILSVQDEFLFWQEKSSDGEEGGLDDRAEAFARHLEGKDKNLLFRLQNMQEYKFAEICSLLKDTKYILSGLWNESNFSRGQVSFRV